MLETNIDDMSGEVYSYIMDSLLEHALDVFYTPIQMKKNRPAIKLSVLADENKVSFIEKILLRETTTFGIRKYAVDRTILERDFKMMTTRFGDLSIKYGYLEGELIKVTPEYEDCKRIAKLHKLPIRDVYQQILIDLNN